MSTNLSRQRHRHHFENLHAGLLEAKHGEGTYAKQDNRFKPQEPLVDVQALVELAASEMGQQLPRVPLPRQPRGARASRRG